MTGGATLGERLLAASGALSGALRVALSAVAAHRGGHELSIAASFLLAQAPALLAIGLAARLAGSRRTVALGGAALLVGLVLFAGDLALRDLAGHRLFPMAAPSGGTIMILGWLVVAAGAIRRGGDAG